MRNEALIAELKKAKVRLSGVSIEREMDHAVIDHATASIFEAIKALEQSEWERVLIERLVVLHILSPEHETNPSKALHDIISYEVLISLDPLVSSDAVALIEKYGGTYPPAEVET